MARLQKVLFLLLWRVWASGNEVHWSQLADAQRLALTESQLVYDSRSDGLWVFGGCSGMCNDFLRRFDFKTRLWSIQAPSTSLKPPAMRQHRMIYDDHHHALWVIASDLWTLDLGTMRWSQPVLAASPPFCPRVGPAVAFDSGSVSLWFHGGKGNSEGQFLSDLWRLDLQSLEWNETAFSASATKPSGRRQHAMVYDNSRHVLWLHGGYIDSSNTHFSDLWQLDLASVTWHELGFGAKPMARSAHMIVHDSYNNVLWLYGGLEYHQVLDDLWKLELDVMLWSQLTFDSKPAERFHHGMVFDASRMALYVHGGQTRSTVHSDLWKLDRVTTTTTNTKTTTKTEQRLSASTTWGLLFNNSGVWALQAFGAYLAVIAAACCVGYLWKLQDVRGASSVPGQLYGQRQSVVDDSLEVPGQARDAPSESRSLLQNWKDRPWFLAMCMLLESMNLVSSTLYVVEAHQRAVLRELSVTCSGGVVLVPVFAADCPTSHSVLNGMNNCDAALAPGETCEADAFAAGGANCDSLMELQNCGEYDVYRSTSCQCAMVAHIVWASAAVSLFCTVSWTCRFYTKRVELSISHSRWRHRLLYTLLGCGLLLIAFTGFLGGGLAVLLMALVCPMLSWLLWLFILVIVSADENPGLTATHQEEEEEEESFHRLQQSAALELPLFNVLIAGMLEEKDIHKLNELRAPLHQGLRFLEDLPECVIGVVDLYFFGGSWFTALGISMSLLMITLHVSMAMSAAVLEKARRIAKPLRRQVRETE